jgi:hypothetical protein
MPTAIIERSRYVISVPREGPALGLLELEVLGLEAGWHAVPGLGGDLVFAGVEGGEDLMLTGSAGAPRLWIKGRGPRKVSLRFEASTSPHSTDRRLLALTLPSSPIHQVELEFPGRSVRMTGPWTAGEGNKFSFALPARDRVELVWMEPTSRASIGQPGPLEGPDACRMETLFLLHSGWISCNQSRRHRSAA